MTVAELRIDSSPDWPVARLSGEIDLSNVAHLTGTLQEAVSNTAQGLVLDLSGVTYLDSTGLRLVFRLARELKDRQQSLRLVVPDESLIWRVLRLSGVPVELEVSPDLTSTLTLARRAS